MWAHSAQGSSPRHALADHLRSTAELAKQFAAPFGMGDLAWALGLFHDAGKASRAWQAGLQRVDGTNKPVGVPHKELGAWLLTERADAAALAILGHHGGLTRLDELSKLMEEGPQPDWEETKTRFLQTVPEAKQVLEGPSLLPEAWTRDPYLCELGLRMVFSALVDADHLDTGAFRRGAQPRVAPPADMEELVTRFEQRRKELFAERKPSPTNEVRAEVYRAAVAAAAHPPGVFRLTAPTGSGKTIATGGFALHHARMHGKSRVIVAVPFTTITEQNAEVYRTLLQPKGVNELVVLEHHSHVDFAGRADDEHSQSTDTLDARLAVENWDAPFVVTTTVQLFDSLFARRPSRMRKLHRLANAVLVLDEVQALPKPLLLPILSALRTLVQHFGTTVLLSSATQPTFEELSVWDGLEAREIVENPQRLFDRVPRVRFEWRLDPRPTLAEIAEEAAAGRQSALVVVNTIKDARTMFELLQERAPDRVWHLSTRMCPEHRRAVLAEVKNCLDNGKPVLLVSTQLIEAGVDIDFPVVFRALAPADSLLQAAGRANREGLLEYGRVVVFDPVDGSQPADYRTAVDVTRAHFGEGRAHPDDLEALARYYPDLYSALNIDPRHVVNQRHRPRGLVIQDNRKELDFAAVAEGPMSDDKPGVRNRALAFRMIDDDGVPVVVAGYDETGEAERYVQRLRDPSAPRRDLLRKLQKWTVNLRRHVLRDPAVTALLEPVIGDLYVWRGVYDPYLGINEAALGEEQIW